MMEKLSEKLNIQIVGIPSSFYEGLSAEAKKILDKADKIFSSRRIYERLVAINALKGKLQPFPEKLSDLPEKIKEEKGNIVITATGDPDFFGITAFLKKYFDKNIEKILPALSTMQEAFAKIKMSWEDAGFLSLHGKSREQLIPFLLKYKKGFIFTSDKTDALFILKTLKELRLEEFSVHIFENIGYEDEKIRCIKFPYLLREPLSDLNVVIFERDGELKDYIGLGIEDDNFDKKRGLITKREVRVNIISLLSLKEGQILWDIGAGSGSVSIEACYNPKGVLCYAIENDSQSFFNLKSNIKKYSAINVKPVFASFRDVFQSLPVPDRVFLGGGGADWLFNLKSSYDMLKKGGILIISLVTAEHLSEAIVYFKENQIEYELYNISCFYTEKIKDSNIFKSKTPVFLIRVRKVD